MALSIKLKGRIVNSSASSTTSTVSPTKTIVSVTCNQPEYSHYIYCIIICVLHNYFLFAPFKAEENKQQTAETEKT